MGALLKATDGTYLKPTLHLPGVSPPIPKPIEHISNQGGSEPAKKHTTDDDLIGEIAAVGVAVLAGYRLYRFGKWLLSPGEPTRPAVTPSTDTVVTLAANELFGLRVDITSEDVDLSAIYADHESDIDRAITEAITADIGEELSVFLHVSTGSVIARVAISCRETIRLNVTRLTNAIHAGVRQVVTTLKSNTVRTAARGVFKVIKVGLPLASALANLADAFGPGASQVVELLRQWIESHTSYAPA